MKEFHEKHPDAENSLTAWNKATKSADWQNFAEVRKTFAAASQVGNLTVFNIGGKKYRLIAYIDYKTKDIFIRHVLTHAEYDKNKWKDDDWYKP